MNTPIKTEESRAHDEQCAPAITVADIGIAGITTAWGSQVQAVPLLTDVNHSTFPVPFTLSPC